MLEQEMQVSRQDVVGDPRDDEILDIEVPVQCLTDKLVVVREGDRMRKGRITTCDKQADGKWHIKVKMF